MVERKNSGFNGWHKPNFSSVVKTDKNFIVNFHGAMLYAHYEMSSIELKREIIKYLKHLDNKHPYLERVKDIHENRLAVIGKYMYILNHGGDIPEKIVSTVMPSLEKIINEEEDKQSKAREEANFLSKETESSQVAGATSKVVISIHDRIREKAREVAGEMEGWVDELILDKKSPPKSVEEFVSLFKANELKGPHMKYIQQSFSRRTSHIELILEGKDKELCEGYSNYTKMELKRFLIFYQNLLKATEMLQEVAKVVRIPRKKKPVSQEKMVSKLKYKKEDSTLGIVSLNPVQIIGAKEVWVFDAKLRKITRYVADDLHGTLNVKGASLIGYNETKSVSKTLRKPVDQLAEFKKCGKVQLRTFMENIKAVEIRANGRMNENSIILKIL